MKSTIGNNRPYRPHRPIADSVADRLEALLARVAGVRRGSDIGRPTTFDVRGQRHAAAVAAADEVPAPRATLGLAGARSQTVTQARTFFAEL